MSQRIGDLISREETLTAFSDYVGSGMSMNDFDALWDIVVKMPPANPWIPVSERLPEGREWYLAVFMERDTGFQLIPRVADYIGKGENKWRIIDEYGLCQEYRDKLECIAWMPLPEPYKVEGSENEK